MPTLRGSAIQADNYDPVPVRPPAPVGMPEPLPPYLSRSPVMIASLPGLGSGHDVVLRQFNGGRNAPSQRILVP